MGPKMKWKFAKFDKTAETSEEVKGNEESKTEEKGLKNGEQILRNF